MKGAPFHALAPGVAKILGSVEAAALVYFIVHRSELHQERAPGIRLARGAIFKPLIYYHTLEALAKDLPYLSLSSIRRHIKRIVGANMLEVSKRNPHLAYDHQHRFTLTTHYEPHHLAPTIGAYKFFVSHAVKYGVLPAVLINHVQAVSQHAHKRSNNCAIDDNGRVYVKLQPGFYARKLGLNRQTISRAINSLIPHGNKQGNLVPGVMLEVQQDKNTAYYVAHPSLDNGGIVAPEARYLANPVNTILRALE